MKHLITLSFSILSLVLYGQMWNGQDTLFGNEWIRYDQSYFKFKVAEDGIYRLSYEQMQQAGVPLETLRGEQFQLFHLGREVPLHLSSNDNLAPGDFLEFYGQQNRSELDRYLFTDPETDMLNPEYSLYTDSAAYFLTWTTTGIAPLRYTVLNNELTDLPAPEPWYWATDMEVFSEVHHKRYQKYGGANVYYSHFDGDGFAHAFTEETLFSLSTSGRVPVGPKASLAINLIGNANAEGHALQIDLNDQRIQSDTFYGTQLKKYTFKLDPAALSEEVQVAVRGLNDTDRYGVALGKIRYPRSFSFDQEAVLQIELPAAAGERYLELSGLANEPLLVVEPEANLRLIATRDGNIHRIKLPARSGTRRLVVSKFSSILPADNLQPIQFKDFESANTNYLILSSDRLFDDGAGNNWVQAYADYRSGAAGGNYRVQILEIGQLFDQFAYGIDFHPLSIRNAINFLLKKRWQQLEYLFIIGRGQEYQNMRREETLKPAIASGNMLIPSFGFPAGDNLLLTSNETKVSPIPLGRLAAINPGEVKIYLDKVKEMEASRSLPQTVADRAWTKHILHLGGGSSAGEQNSIQFNLETLAQEIEQSTFGGSVRAFYKNSTDAIQNSLSQEIFDYINQGTSMITFFGHSSPGTFDFNIDNPDNYDNQGRYPYVMSLGCYSGNIFGSGRSIGERFTFYEDKAAVVFGASRGLGFISSLANFARSFYRNIGETHYGGSIGVALQATYREHDSSNWIGMETLVEQFTIHGDPAIRLHPVDGPDYVIDAASTAFSPQLISTQLDSFTLAFDAVNLGTNELDTVSLVLNRTFPDGEKIELLKDTVVMDRFRKRLTYTLPVGGGRSTGQNIFEVSIDVDKQVAERPAPAAELNNELVRSNGEAGIPLFIIDNTARTVYPPEFALIGDRDITLKASTTDALAPERSYWLEIDTTAQFNSPGKVRLTQQQRGGVLKWTPDLNWQDGRAYYWRVSPAVSAESPEPVWSTSSFTYISGSAPGWRQGHYGQFKENTQSDLIFTDSTREISFGREFLDMRVRNKVWDENDRPGFFYNNGNPAGSVRPWQYLDQGISVIVFRPNTGSNWRNTGQQYGSVDGRNNSVYSFNTQEQEDRNELVTFLNEIVPEGYIVFLFTVQANATASFAPEVWALDSLDTGVNIFSALEAEGADLVRELADKGSVPYVFIYTKGQGKMAEGIADNLSDEINVATVISRSNTSGILASKVIGPAAQWDNLTWNPLPGEINVVDTLQIDLIGIRADGIRDTLLEQLPQIQSLDMIDAAVYPFLQLSYRAKDEVDRNPAFLQHWTIRYEGVPEFAINPALANYNFQSDTLQQGIQLQLTATVENLSTYSSDSVDIQFTVLDAQNQEQTSRQVKAGLSGNGQAEFEFQLPSDDLQGRYSLTAEVNPDRKQLEHHYFNNLLNQNFEVVTDRKNPLLDVTFDGRVLLNGDLVGAEPFISIRLKDENPYLLLSDTSLLALELKTPDGRSERISLSSPEVQYTAADNGNKNEFNIDYQPTFTQDGTYELSVNGRDVSGNFSGALDYRVAFEVRTRNSISNVLNYPNPFSTRTQFVYTLTGSAPTFFKIQILNVSGRVVREITQDEIGPLQIGTHRTEFAWDGTDEFGDRLANGIYLYRIVAKDEKGQDFESYDSYVEDTGLSGFFERGFGKMVLLR